MKKLILSMLAGMMALGAMAQGNVFTVKGTFDWEKDSVNFLLVDPIEMHMVTTTKLAITGEMLEMEYDLTPFGKALMLYVVFDENGRQTYMSVPAIPGETVEFYRDGEPVTRLRGSQFYVDYDEAEQSIEAPLIDIRNFVGECRHKYELGVPEEELQKEFEEKYPVYQKAFMDALMGYVKAHPDQEASAALLATIAEAGSESMVEDIEAAEALLTERVRNSPAAGLYKDFLEAAKKEREKDDIKNTLEGSTAPDFILNDINGNPMALSSLRGKWVVIDFWGSWCGWCIKGLPKMKEYYAKYGDKLEILGVDCKDTVEKWKAAVAKYEIPWMHVYWDMEKGDNPVKIYGVQGFPTKVVVNPEGKVAKIIVGEDPAFYEYLDEILK